MSIKHNKRYKDESKLSKRTNRQIKICLKENIIPKLILEGIKQGLNDIDAKKIVQKIVGKNNKERLVIVRSGIFDDILGIT